MAVLHSIKSQTQLSNSDKQSMLQKMMRTTKNNCGTVLFLRLHCKSMNKQHGAQGNPISVAKAFATKNCALCAKERMTVLTQQRSIQQLLIMQTQTLIPQACKADRPLC